MKKQETMQKYSFNQSFYTYAEYEDMIYISLKIHLGIVVHKTEVHRSSNIT
jgi:hypothetical protein